MRAYLELDKDYYVFQYFSRGSFAILRTVCIELEGFCILLTVLDVTLEKKNPACVCVVNPC